MSAARTSIDQLVEAHKHSDDHAEEICASERCGCFYCLAVFNPSDVGDWLHFDDKKPVASQDRRRAALCPNCGIDSVIGSASGFPITAEFLTAMREHWFR